MNLQRNKSHFVSIGQQGRRTKFVSTTHDHVEAFQSLIKYLVRLRRDGDIDNKTFDNLVRQAAASFVETEVSERFDRVLEGRISFDRLLELL
jgi:ribosomal protein L19E